ncbi:BREX-1 system adenine-specific DNA-methyltransferase PglX [Lactiplantibacillus plantarum]|uniref:BREX-1 system adenine-specific DNA-methyltransferase PglX n=2 Tax=Lactiplantibacillus plantarum TaxID=1590 RepID=UPI0006A61995|nr:BREX-1 system adenine-specific DNA-methyltransferase PglX [Lactiplantibacillus plantarum]ASD33154.1 restriction endonuclease subunit M [Lactiplantibacillus plantarum]AXI11988.1 BREX-1 system adenine-specific DNA-methyltransferase PglX [Lactiplantibacillus plantarum]KOE72630.1 restriction endonuclease subunit M [Lactiplantibacillus plantarum]MBW4798933.1 BREX-1 system adenine-specific DNA-methyltransferase PglX [Lactiplantibacillus plantarum]MBW4806932.1 BREX-1 system adenine-specific DNA-me
MDKTAIKNFAIESRRKLIAAIKLQMKVLGITEEQISDKLETSTSEIEYYVDDRNPITGSNIVKRQKLVVELHEREKATDYETAYNELVEEVAYTWFNRLIAIRFMEVNGYLPSWIRVLSSSSGRNEPDIMLRSEADLVPYLGAFSNEEQAIMVHASETEATVDMDAKYRMLFIKQANALNANLPHLFEKTNDYAELLFTPNYHDGVIQHLINDIDEVDFDVTRGGQVEIIGWLYQYYNTEPHDYAVNITGGAVTKNEIPAATQLFTTDWVVRYMVDNSLGKYWLERHPNSDLKSNLDYLLPGEIQTVDSSENLEDMRLIDNAMGSGHILVYAFDVFMKMYAEQGYSSRDAALSIVQNNLYGLEIDKRAYQLAYFALMMKARQYNRRALQPEKVKLNVHVFEDTDTVSPEFLDALSGEYADDIKQIIELFSNAGELGSIIKFDKTFNWTKLRENVEDMHTDALDIFGMNQSKKIVLKVLTIGEIMSTKYDVAVTNPPYLNKFDPDMKKYVKKNYADYSGDLFSVFIFNNINLVKIGGYAAYMTPFVWMFIKTYEKLRSYLVANKEISSLIQMEYSAFEEATVPINTFVLKNVPNGSNGTYIKLSAFKGGMNVQRDKVLEAIANPDIDYLYRTNQANFKKIPGSPIAYWASKNLIHDFEVGKRMENIVVPKVGLQTGDNKIFLRFWYEVGNQNICYSANTISESTLSGKRWFPYNKGGSYRKWFGNYDYVVNWQDNGKMIKEFTWENGNARSVVRNPRFYFQESITWSDITSGDFSARYRTPGSIFDVVGKSAFKLEKQTDLLSLLGLLNAKVTNYIFKILNPTIHLQTGNFANFPVINSKISVYKQVQVAIEITQNDWNSFEESWDFIRHPLLSHIADDKQTEVGGRLENAFAIWKTEAQERFDQLKANEEELNRIFIDLYGLNDELTPEVEDKEVSVRRADEERDIKSLLSYFIGLVFGRYSLDTLGLAYAGGEWNTDKYQKFVPNKDNLLLLNDDRYFDDDRDIMNRFRTFLAVTFGEEHVQENMDYIAHVIGKKADNSEQAIRKYFVDDFFKDHKKGYQKRPIYWEFNSGKQNGLKALMYLHRYDEGELAMMRTDYMYPLQSRYEERIEKLQQWVQDESVTKTKKQLEKKLKHVTQQLKELKQYDPIVRHVADQRINLDLDDGVLVNYEKLQDGNKILSKL